MLGFRQGRSRELGPRRDEADRRRGLRQSLEQRVEPRGRDDRARAGETKERHDRVEVRVELGGVVGISERHRYEAGRRDAHERGQKAVGVRNDDRHVVAPLEPARAERASEIERRVAQHLEGLQDVATVRSDEDEPARARGGVVERLRDGTAHRAPPCWSIRSRRWSLTCAMVRIFSMSLSGIETSKRSSSSAISSKTSSESKPRSRARSLSAVGSMGRRLTRLTIAMTSVSSGAFAIVIDVENSRSARSPEHGTSGPASERPGAHGLAPPDGAGRAPWPDPACALYEATGFREQEQALAGGRAPSEC